MPGCITGEPQAQMGELGLDVSVKPPLTTVDEPILIGNKQLQHTSVIGFTKLPWQVALAKQLFERIKIAKQTIKRGYFRREFMAQSPK
jgi:hypothetical protein